MAIWEGYSVQGGHLICEESGLEACSYHSSPLHSYFLPVFLVTPRRLVETNEAFGMAFS